MKLTPKTRLVVGAGLILAIVAMLAVWRQLDLRSADRLSGIPSVEGLAAPENGSLAVSVEGFIYEPFGTMKLQVAGLDAEAATSVVFTGRTGKRITVPALDVTAAGLEVPVPPFMYDAKKGEFTPDQATLIVVQAKRVGDKMMLRSSNRSRQFMVSAPQRPRGNDGQEASRSVGAIAQIVLSVAEQRLISSAAKLPEAQAEVIAAIDSARAGMTELRVGIEKIKRNPNTTVKVKMTDGSAATLGRQEVAALDALFSGYLGHFSSGRAVGAGRPNTLFAPAAEAAKGSACVDAILGNPNTEAGLSNLVVFLCNVTDGDMKLLPSNDVLPFNFYYMAQMAASFALDEASGPWGLAAKIASGTELSMAFDLAVSGKLPELGGVSLDLLRGLGGEIADMILKNRGLLKTGPGLSQLMLCIDAWDLLAKAFPNLHLLSSKDILLGVRDILIDIGERMIDGTPQPLVDAMPVPDESSYLELGPSGLDGGYDPIVGPDAVPDTMPRPYYDGAITPLPTPPAPRPTPTPVPTPTCSEQKEAALKQCQADCPNEMTIEEYSDCTAGCDGVRDLLEKSNCSNRCIGAWTKSKTVRSDCIRSCLNANYAVKCP